MRVLSSVHVALGKSLINIKNKIHAYLHGRSRGVDPSHVCCVPVGLFLPFLPSIGVDRGGLDSGDPGSTKNQSAINI